MSPLGRWRYAILASLAVNVALVVLVASFALAPHQVGNRLASHLGLATSAQAASAQSTADDAQTDADQADSDAQDAQSSIGDISSYGTTVGDALDSIQDTTDDLDGRLAVVEKAEQAACGWASSESLSFIGDESLFTAFEDYQTQVC